MDLLLPHKKRERTSYHTDVKIAVKLNILPENLRKRIPKSTLSTFRNSDYSHVFGIEYSEETKAGVEIAKKIVKCEAVIRIYRAYNCIKNTVITIVSSIKGLKSHAKQWKEKIVSTIMRIKDTLGLERACRYFNISASRFYSWLYQVKYKCPVSPLKKCRRKWPNQVTDRELVAMKKCFDNPFYRGWAVYQIAVHALLNNRVSACVGTWYKYIHELGISLNRIKKQKQKTGIRTDRPNGIWHIADARTLFGNLQPRIEVPNILLFYIVSAISIKTRFLVKKTGL